MALIKIGTRGSDLALWQANFVKNKLEKLGYIHIRPDWEDARKKLVSISQSGVDARDNAMQKIKPLLNKIISNSININERELLAELRKFREKVENSFVEN